LSGDGKTLTTSSAEETEAVGACIAAGLAPGDVVLVSGDVGSGKSTLVRGACRAMGIAGPVTSPTFTIGRRYEGGRIPVSHLDLYRLETLEGEDPALLDDYVGPDSVAFIEWADAAEPHLLQDSLRVRLRHAGGDCREIEIEPAGSGSGSQ
jgi:tRNA threonylcarbamoyladenosine biosynthesis protein TsaE